MQGVSAREAQTNGCRTLEEFLAFVEINIQLLLIHGLIGGNRFSKAENAMGHKKQSTDRGSAGLAGLLDHRVGDHRVVLDHQIAAQLRSHNFYDAVFYLAILADNIQNSVRLVKLALDDILGVFP